MFLFVLVWQVTPEVVTLTPSTFTEHIDKHKYTLVLFYAPDCGHCKELLPKYDEAEHMLKEAGASIPFVKVDATITDNKVGPDQQLTYRYSVSSFPALFWFENDVDEYFEPPKKLGKYR